MCVCVHIYYNYVMYIFVKTSNNNSYLKNLEFLLYQILTKQLYYYNMSSSICFNFYLYFFNIIVILKLQLLYKFINTKYLIIIYFNFFSERYFFPQRRL